MSLGVVPLNWIGDTNVCLPVISTHFISILYWHLTRFMIKNPQCLTRWNWAMPFCISPGTWTIGLCRVVYHFPHTLTPNPPPLHPHSAPPCLSQIKTGWTTSWLNYVIYQHCTAMWHLSPTETTQHSETVCVFLISLVAVYLPAYLVFTHQVR